jgi:voltage-gated potassium channel
VGLTTGARTRQAARPQHRTPAVRASARTGAAYRVAFPRPAVGPLLQVARRLLLAVLVLAVTVLIVYADRGGYHDNADDSVSFLDALYYSTVTLSTTGYGDVPGTRTGADRS